MVAEDGGKCCVGEKNAGTVVRCQQCGSPHHFPQQMGIVPALIGFEVVTYHLGKPPGTDRSQHCAWRWQKKEGNVFPQRGILLHVSQLPSMAPTAIGSRGSPRLWVTSPQLIRAGTKIGSAGKQQEMLGGGGEC